MFALFALVEFAQGKLVQVVRVLLSVRLENIILVKHCLCGDVQKVEVCTHEMT